jgi:hypothetical protein
MPADAIAGLRGSLTRLRRLQLRPRAVAGRRPAHRQSTLANIFSARRRQRSIDPRSLISMHR